MRLFSERLLRGSPQPPCWKRAIRVAPAAWFENARFWVMPGLWVRAPVGSPIVAGLCDAGRSGRAGVADLGYNRRRHPALIHAALAVLAVASSALLFQAVTTAHADDGKKSDGTAPANARSRLPDRALVQIGTNNLRTQERIGDVALTPDAKLIAAATAGNADFSGITLFDIRTGAEVKVLSHHDRRREIHRIAFSPDGSKLLSGEFDGYVTLWDWTKDRILFHEKLHGGGGVVNNVIVDQAAHSGTVSGVAFSPDGAMFATAGSDGAVHLRRVDSPKAVVRDFKTPWSMAGRPNGLMAGVGRKPPPKPGLEIATCLAFTPDSARLAIGSGDTISVWRIKDGQLAPRITTAHGDRVGARNSSLASLAVTPDGRTIISGASVDVPVEHTSFKDVKNVLGVRLSDMRYWNIETGQRITSADTPDHQGLGYATLSPDGKRLAMADLGVLRILDASSGKSEQTIPWPECGWVRPAFSSDGALVATANGNAVGLFDARTGKRIHHSDSEPSREPTSSAWSPSGNRIATCHRDGFVRVWEANTGRLLWWKVLSSDLTPMGNSVEPHFVTFSRDGRRVIAAGGRDFDSGVVAIYEASRGLLVRTVALPAVTLATLSPDREILVVAASCKEARSNALSRLHAIEVATGRQLWATPPEETRNGFLYLLALQFRPDSRSLDMVQYNGNVIRFDRATGKEMGRFEADARTVEQQKAHAPRSTPQSFWLAAFSPDSRMLVTSARQFVHVWNVDSGKLLRTIERSHKRACYFALATDGKTVATADPLSPDDYGSNTILIYDINTGKQVRTLEPHDNRPIVMSFSPDSQKLFTGFRRGSGMVWDVRGDDDAPK